MKLPKLLIAILISLVFLGLVFSSFFFIILPYRDKQNRIKFLETHSYDEVTNQGAHVFSDNDKIALRGTISDIMLDKGVMNLVMNGKEILVKIEEGTGFMIACGASFDSLKPLDKETLKKGEFITVSIKKVLGRDKVLTDLISTCRK